MHLWIDWLEIHRKLLTSEMLEFSIVYDLYWAVTNDIVKVNNV